MNPKHLSRKTIWIICLCAAMVAAFLILFFWFNKPSPSGNIVVPELVPVLPTDSETNQQTHTDFLEVSNQNVADALNTLTPTTSYFQRYFVSVGTELHKDKQVDLWVNGNLIKTIVTDGITTKTLLSDGKDTYLWYEGDKKAVSVRLTDTRTLEDILGMPDLNGHFAVDSAHITDSAYEYLEDVDVPCLYYSVQSQDQLAQRFWIDLNTGLIYQTDMLENGEQVYVMLQLSYEALAQEDERFTDCFLLPDGSNPFTAAEEMPQP